MRKSLEVALSAWSLLLSWTGKEKSPLKRSSKINVTRWYIYFWFLYFNAFLFLITLNASSFQNRELQILRELRHPNIVSLIYYFYSVASSVSLLFVNYKIYCCFHFHNFSIYLLLLFLFVKHLRNIYICHLTYTKDINIHKMLNTLNVWHIKYFWLLCFFLNKYIVLTKKIRQLITISYIIFSNLRLKTH